MPRKELGFPLKTITGTSNRLSGGTPSTIDGKFEIFKLKAFLFHLDVGCGLLT
jgi:hypothetical protein